MISVIVVNYNGMRFIKGCLTSLAKQTAEDFEVIVVDNGSDDGSEGEVQKYYARARLLKLKDNKGYPAALNRGIGESHGDFILTLNNDTELDPLFIEELLSTSDDEPATGMWATKMVLPDGRINSTGICISRSGAAWDRGMFQEDTRQFDEPGEVFGPCAGAALYRRKMLEDIGLFDEDFFLYMEDVDIAFRGRLAGWTCRYIPSARVVHQQGGTSGYGSDLSVYYGNRNILWYVVKDFPAGLLMRYLPWIVGRNLAVLLYYGIRGHGMVALRAKVDGIAGLGRMVRKRRSVVRKISNRELAKCIRKWDMGR
jgi:GT2 family glycosyltransferase